MQLPRKMSAHITATIGRLGNRHSESKPAGNEVKLAGEESKDRLYEPKHRLKLVRVLTVVAYMISVSLAAIVLSLYYMYLWDPSSRLLAKRINATNSTQPAGPKAACLELTPQADSDPLQDFAADSSTAGLADVPGPSASPHRTKNLFEMLTSRPSLRELDYATDVPMEPSADGFQPDYRDSTTELPEDLLDD